MNVNKQLEQILVAVIKPILHFLKIHRKVIFGNPPVVVQDMFSKTPKSLNAVDVVSGPAINQLSTMREGVVFTQTLERIVTPEGIGVVDRALSRFLPDDGHQLLFGDVLDYPGVDLAIALQKAKNNVFTPSTATALALSSAAKVTLVHLHLAIQSATIEFRHMIDGFTQALVKAGDCLVIKAQVVGQTIGRLLLVETLDDGDLGPNLPQRLLFSTARSATTNVTASGSRYLKRTAENTLFTPQKVGYATKNILSPLCHMDILVPYGYETH